MLILEALAAIFGLLSVYLLTRQSIWAWPTGLVSVAVAALVFYDSFLYSDMLLHVYYIGMNVYGWVYWLRGGPRDAELPVTTMTWRQNVSWVVVTVVLTLAWGWSMSHLDVIAGWVLAHISSSIAWAQAWSSGGAPTPAFPYGDAATTVASLVAMWFMARKRLENWAYWFVIDVVAIVIYALKGLYLFSGQYIIFLILCIMGYRGWSRSMSAPLEASKDPLHP